MTSQASAHQVSSLRRISAWHLVTTGVVAAVVGLSAYGGGDPDLFWHRVLGGQWVASQSVHLPNTDPISYSEGRRWIPSAWAVEVLYDRIVALTGYAGIGILRLVLTLLVMLGLVRYLSSQLRSERTAIVLLFVSMPLALDIQDRPQTFSFLFAALMLPTIHRWYLNRELPGAAAVVAFTWIWANIHGLWTLVPCLLFVALLADVLTRKRRRTPANLVGISLAAGALTPVGPELLLIPFRVRGSADLISEWQSTNLGLPFTWGFAASVLFLFATAMTRDRLPFHQALYVIAVAAFGMMAFRNVIVSSILLLPPVVEAARSIRPGMKSKILLPRAAVVLAGSFLVLVGTATYLREPVIPPGKPSLIAARLAAKTGPVRVVNDYNVSGYLREFGGEGIRLAIDGRADRWGSGTIREYGEMTEGIRGWRARLESYDPQAVVVHRSSPLREHLNADGWLTEVVDQYYVLLVPAPRSAAGTER